MNDHYLGSGKYLLRAIDLYGIDNFEKEILYVFKSEEEMNAKEANLVTEEYCNRKYVYNLCPGGHGRFKYINSIEELNNSNRNKEVIANKIRERLKGKPAHPNSSKATRERHRLGLINYATWKGKNLSDTHKQNIGLANSKLVGDKNSQYGTMWITDGVVNKKIKKDDPLPLGFRRGKIIKDKTNFKGNTKAKDTIYVNNGIINKRISKHILIPEGFVKGRLL